MVESGIFYSTVIDPVLAGMRKRIARQINPGEKVLDVACGTGAQVFEMAKTAREVVGADLSESMYKKALKTLKKKKPGNVSFCLCDATEKLKFNNKEFDVATMSLALHQFPPEMHETILSEMKRVARKIIIIDYAFPLPKNITGTGSKVAEFFAGREHHRNFKRYMRLGGLPALLAANNLRIKNQVFFAQGAFHLVECTA
ncbi:demethylmenaquinone methyltransferase / 2-methoxy-6-polyprenyl-1,4-benzoquinol methylase [Tangfeifania diversioriginum]|uniref:Demethylmenaquinone methyltransferase / 2-methoxy-6-polyprenyl-1,4-benzoquinol methylase n=1 Tax=Tangfeifania diversioriginum TaxID=1168035 RepID=A0A1M6JTQ9_9BACT|nr:methyltransferase domain-containing protein [Tangfeifania diversioriginum]SHJ50046.1 demethylmenaquinone methyltransferase / 2-methoxy-6-polyprenyl-1,4-benzoquinol methylase [Tangfeifania diversioriginum]